MEHAWTVSPVDVAYRDLLSSVIGASLRKRAAGYPELGLPDPREVGN
ncbi:hypothetical protein [Nocardia sp. NPDC052566]